MHSRGRYATGSKQQCRPNPVINFTCNGHVLETHVYVQIIINVDRKSFIRQYVTHELQNEDVFLMTYNVTGVKLQALCRIQAAIAQQ